MKLFRLFKLAKHPASILRIVILLVILMIPTGLEVKASSNTSVSSQEASMLGG